MLIITQLGRFTPDWVRVFIAKIIGILWYIATPRRRVVIRENLITIKGSVRESEIRRTFINFARIYSDVFNIPNMNSSYVQSMVKPFHLDFLREGLDKGRGVILIGAHLGGVELAGSYLSSLGFPLYTVAESKGPGMRFFRFYNRYREHFGNTILPLEERKLTFNLVKLLKKNKVVVLIADRDIQGSGVDMKFFDRIASIPRGIILLSRRTGAPIVVGVAALDPDSPRYLVRLFPPLYPEDFDSADEMFTVMVDLLEKEIRLFPLQWFVFQKIWKDNKREGKIRDEYSFCI